MIGPNARITVRATNKVIVFGSENEAVIKEVEEIIHSTNNYFRDIKEVEIDFEPRTNDECRSCGSEYYSGEDNSLKCDKCGWRPKTNGRQSS